MAVNIEQVNGHGEPVNFGGRNSPNGGAELNLPARRATGCDVDFGPVFRKKHHFHPPDEPGLWSSGLVRVAGCNANDKIKHFAIPVTIQRDIQGNNADAGSRVA